MIWIIVGVVVVGFVGSIGFVRSLKHEAADWHVDPLIAPDPTTPNWYRVSPNGENAAPVFTVPVADLARAFGRVVAKQPRIEVLQDDRAAGGPVTWVQRSALFGFPDYISVQFVPSGEGSATLAIFSRSRLGQSDLGVNKKRVTAWLAALEAELA